MSGRGYHGRIAACVVNAADRLALAAEQKDWQDHEWNFYFRCSPDL